MRHIPNMTIQGLGQLPREGQGMNIKKRGGSPSPEPQPNIVSWMQMQDYRKPSGHMRGRESNRSGVKQ
jgi:hypothetical protein